MAGSIAVARYKPDKWKCKERSPKERLDAKQPNSSSGAVLRWHIAKGGQSIEDGWKLLRLKVLEQASRDAGVIAGNNPGGLETGNGKNNYRSSYIIDAHIALENWLKYEEIDGIFNAKDICEENQKDFKKFRSEILDVLNHRGTAS
jgi:hypothetical protein